MATLSINKDWADGEVLLEADLDNVKDDVETFLNTTKINDDNIQNAGITASSKLIDASISAAKLAADSVTTAKIIDGALSADATGRAKMADGFVNAAKLATDSVTKVKLADGAKNLTRESKASNFTASSATEMYECDTSSGSITATLPAASSNEGLELTFVKTNASNSLIIDADSTELVNGATTFTMVAIYESVTVSCNASKWFITRHVVPTANFEPVVVRAKRTSSLSISAATETIVNYDSESIDSHSAYNNSNGKFTCPIAGDYMISATGYIQIAGHTLTEVEISKLSYRVNGTGDYFALGGAALETVNASRVFMSGTDIVTLAKDDYLEINCYQNSENSATLINDSTRNHIAICRVR